MKKLSMVKAGVLAALSVAATALPATAANAQRWENIKARQARLDARIDQGIRSCALTRNEAGDAELGYWIAEKRWGRGYATEAARALLATAAGLGHRRIVSGHFTDNPASGAVLAKLGFRRTGTVQSASLARGGRSEMVTMALGSEEERPAGPCDLPMAA